MLLFQVEVLLKYYLSNSIITLTAAGKVTNAGTRYSNPVIKIYGSGDINLTVASQVIKLTSIASHIILDSELEDCYDSDGDNLNNSMSGEFPILNVGDNNISWTGAVTRVEIIPNFRLI